MRYIGIVVVIILVGSVSSVQSDLLYVSATQNAPYYCDIPGYAFTLTTFYVIHEITSGATGCRFSIPFADCMSGYMITGEYSSYTVSGDIQSGITIDYTVAGPCQASTVVALTVNIFGTPGDCCYLVPHPHPASSARRAEAFDCAGGVVEVVSATGLIDAGGSCSCGLLNCNTIAPDVTNLSPPDGATEVPMNTVMTWNTFDPENMPTKHAVFFGTSPDPPKVEDYYLEYSYDPGPLAPETTYYWRVGAWTFCDFVLVEGPTWQFTTESPVAAKKSTWGSIKSIYRAN